MPLRLILACFLLFALFYFVGAAELLNVLLELRPVYIFYLILLTIVMIWASCLKWQLFVRSGGHQVGILHLMKLYTVGYFFNIFTPSYVGGDVARSFHLGKRLDNQRDAFISTFLERFTGLLAMSFLGVLFVIVGTEATKGVELAVLIVGAGTAIFAIFCFSDRLHAWGSAKVLSSLRQVGMSNVADKLDRLFVKIDQGMKVARGDWRLLGKAMLLSLFFHLLTVINTYVAARAVGWENPDLAGLFVVVPLVLLVGMAPITPSGLGIQEGAFLFFLERIGGTRAQSLGVGLVLRAKIMLVALLGGLLWLQVRRQTGVNNEVLPKELLT